MKISPGILILFLLIAQAGLGQSTFKKSYTAPGDDEALGLDVGPDGSIIVAGRTTGGSGGGQDALLTKFDADGNVLWSKTFGNAGTDYFWMVKSTSDGGYLAVGRMNNDLYALKLDGGGGVQWEQAFGQGGVDEAFNCLEVADGYLVSGTVEQFSGNRDGFVMKLDLGGAYVWGKVYQPSGGAIFGEMAPGANGEFWLGGGATGNGALLHLNASGNVLSGWTTGGSFNESHYFLKPGGSGYIASDASWSFTGNSSHNPWLIQYNAQGGLVWSKFYPFPMGNSRINADACPDGGFIFTPYFYNNNLPNAYLVKTDAGGNVSWAKSYTYEGTGKMRQAKSIPGGYVLAGQMSGSGSNGLDLFLIKTDASGNIAGLCCPSDYAIAAQTGSVSVTTPAFPTLSPGLTGTNGFTTDAPSPAVVDRCMMGGSCCITYAGTVTNGTTTICLPNPAEVPHNGNQVLDNNDILRYILFSNPNDTLGSILATSATPSFSFNAATMQTGVVYHVAAIAGNNLNGNVNLADPCLDISNAAQVIWRPSPTVSFSTSTPDICTGNCRVVSVVFTGTAPFTLTYSAPGLGPVSQVFPGNNGTFSVCAPAGTAPGAWLLQATALTDGFCSCP